MRTAVVLGAVIGTIGFLVGSIMAFRRKGAGWKVIGTLLLAAVVLAGTVAVVGAMAI
jgi:hypothetical protein